ncbi:MAG: RNA-binding transcriptional accessory protein, partial [Muribaculaceae bacterium]|nr:RNA-binding transcriptional accessory protein [Muribaculaceae bacterium]
MSDLAALAAQRLNLPLNSVRATAQLLAQGATVPFISRYRKEVTGNLDEVAVRDIQLELERLDRLDKRREAIKESIESRGLMTPEIAGRLDEAETLNALEDLYLPYRPKRRTRATAARELGLEPLARMIMKGAQPASASLRFIGDKVGSVDEAVAGAGDIIA